MRKRLITAALLVLLPVLAWAGQTPTVNPMVPAPNTPLNNAVVQGNFQKTYNDLLNIYNILETFGNIVTQNIPLSIPNGGTGLTSVGPNGTCLKSTGSVNAYGSCGGSGGGGGLTSQQIVSSGSAATAICGEFVGFNSASGLAKTLTIPASTGSLCIIATSDMFGDAFTNNITPVPVSGSILGSPSVYTSHGSITLLDTTSGWVSL